MRRMLFIFVAFLAGVLPASAQISISNELWTREDPLKFVNQTSRTVLVQVGSRTHIWLAPDGGYRTYSPPIRVLGVERMNSFDIAFHFCGSVPDVEANPIPAWLASRELLGEAALYPGDYGPGSLVPTKVVESRVKEAKRRLKTLGIPGWYGLSRKDMERRADDWVRGVKRGGYGYDVRACDNATVVLIPVVSYSRYAYQGSSQRTLVLVEKDGRFAVQSSGFYGY